MHPFVLFLICSLCGAQANVITRNATTVRGAANKIYVSGEHNRVTISLNAERLWAAIKVLQQRVSALEYKPSTPPTFDLRFHSAGVTDYVFHRGLTSMRALTYCFWVKTADRKNEATVISYAVSGRINEILIIDLRRILIWIGDAQVRTNVAANDGNWHHICLTWASSGGAWVLYKDGRAAANGQGLKTGHVVGSGGALVIGQEQDSLGGGFEGIQSFVGDLTGLNIWSKVLGPSEISQMSAACTAGEGDAFKWRDVIKGIHGHVQVVRPSTCSKA